MARVELRGVTKAFGLVRAVQKADITFEEGSFTTLLGPSGCGKTTILRMISGLESPTSGDILIGDQRVNEIPIHKRNLGLVFQNYALFPHKTIAENIAFGLKYRSVEKSEMQERVKNALEVVRLPGVEDRYPAQLSGGQQQRIALARAIVIEPSVLLLDEPLSALDANLREEMRVELTAIQHRIGVTTIFVTHDQSEALAMSDRIIVMSAGNVEQVGTPREVYNAPRSEFVANFLGAANILQGEVVDSGPDGVAVDNEVFGTFPVSNGDLDGLRPGDPVRVVMRAEKVKLSRAPHGDGMAAAGQGSVEAVDYQGQVVRYFIRSGECQLQVIDMIEDRPFAVDEQVFVGVRGVDCSIVRS